MLTGKRHLFHVQHFFALHAQPGFALLTIQVIVTHIDAKAHAAFISSANRHRQRIVGVNHTHFRVLIDAQFRCTVLLQPKRVSVHMIFSHVQNSGRHSLQAGGGFQLEAG
ncbi:hypothetical protein D3C81_1606360 [compost metagenome]